MIELKRLKLINWHNFENTTFDCARLTYMIGVNAVGKTTILDAIRYCLTTNRNFNALGNKKSGRTLQGSVHAKQRGENAYRRPGRTVAYIGAEFWDSAKRTPFVIAVRVESEGPMQELHPGDQTWYISEDGITLEQLPFIDPRTGAPSAKEDFKPAEGRLSYTRSPSEARDRICRALGIGRASSPLGKKFNEVFQMGTSMDEIPNFREFLYQYILPQPELDLEALQGDRLELENLHAVLAEAHGDDVAQVGQAMAVQRRAGSGLNQLGAKLVDDLLIVAVAPALFEDQRVGVRLPQQILRLVDFVRRIDRHKHRADFCRRPEGDIPSGHIRCPYRNVVAALYTHCNERARKSVHVVAELWVGPCIIELRIPERILVRELLAHPIEYVREGLVNEHFFAPYVFSRFCVVVLQKRMIFLLICCHVMHKLWENDTRVGQLRCPAFYPFKRNVAVVANALQRAEHIPDW